MESRIDITLTRFLKVPFGTFGTLEYDGHSCYTLEPIWRDYQNGEKKVTGKSAIPAGSYLLTPYKSPKNKMVVPLLHDVPDFDMVEIHVGNTVRDTKGCILLGEKAEIGEQHGEIYYSRSAFNKFMAWFDNQTLDSKEVWLTIED